jgi:branched-chain amino acid transport system substrate-binding protein
VKSGYPVLAGLLLCTQISGCAALPARVSIGIALTRSNHPAVEFAVSEINTHGGIRGIPLEVVGLDWDFVSRAEPKEIFEWSNRFARDEDLVAVIGHSDSASTLSAAALYNSMKLPQIVTIATNPAITNIGPWTYRICLSDSFQGPALAEHSVKDWNKRRIGVFYVNDDYGRGLAELFESHVVRLGAKIEFSVLHRNLLDPDDQEHIRSVIARINRGEYRPDLIALFQRTEAADWTLAELRRSEVRVDLLGGDSLGLSGFAEADPALKEGMRISAFFHPRPENPKSERFAKDYRRVTGTEATYGDAFAYDAIYLVRDAVLSEGFSRQAIRSYLDRLIRERIEVDGASGKFVLGEDHDARRALYIVEIRSGTHHFIKSLEIR